MQQTRNYVLWKHIHIVGVGVGLFFFYLQLYYKEGLLLEKLTFSSTFLGRIHPPHSFCFLVSPPTPICLCLSDGGWGWDIRLLSDIPLGPGSVKLNEVWTDPDSWCQPHNYPKGCSCESLMCIIKDIYSSTYTTVTYLSKANWDSRK